MVKLTLTYKCDVCGNQVAYSVTDDLLYGDITAVLPPGWGHHILPPPILDNMQDLCPTCMEEYRQRGIPVETWWTKEDGDLGDRAFYSIFGENCQPDALER